MVIHLEIIIIFFTELKMSRTVGTVARGIRCPIVQEGDDIVEIVVEALKNAWRKEGFEIRDRDVVGITESIVARAQGNYVTLDDIASEIRNRFGDEVGVVFPILSRNRFAMILKGIAAGARQVHLLLSYPSDEVGNQLMDIEKMDELDIDPSSRILTEEEFRELFGYHKHEFTGIDYIDYYKEQGTGDNIKVILSNNPADILSFTKNVLVADIHSRHRTKRLLEKAGAETVFSLDDICCTPRADAGYNEECGLLGANKATEDKIKLFPRDGHSVVEGIQKRIKEITGKDIEVMIYGDGAFKDPRGKIWELADPVVSPAFTPGLNGTPSEIKLKYFADNRFAGMKGEEINRAMKESIRAKGDDLVGKIEAQGTTPRQLTDLLGSLCDLISGSGDKGTPIILIQGYFDNYASD